MSVGYGRYQWIGKRGADSRALSSSAGGSEGFRRARGVGLGEVDRSQSRRRRYHVVGSGRRVCAEGLRGGDAAGGVVSNRPPAPEAGAVKVTETPLTGTPPFVTVATNGLANGLRIVALCP